MGKPDAVFTMQEDYPIPASGTIDYKFFEVPTNLTEDRWVQAFEVRPGNRAVVHHVIVYVRRPIRLRAAPRPRRRAGWRARPTPPFAFGERMRRPADAPEAGEGKRSTTIGRRSGTRAAGWPVTRRDIRCASTSRAPALKIPEGAIITVQMHYTRQRQGRPTDRTQHRREVRERAAEDRARGRAAARRPNFVLKAGDARHARRCRDDAQHRRHAVERLPHTHVRGKSWEVAAIYPDGRTEMILNVPKYDFNWQTDYIFKKPLQLPKGTKLKTSAWYDNSTANKSNPDPTKDVYWGDQTWEEMQFTAFTFSINKPPASTTAGAK